MSYETPTPSLLLGLSPKCLHDQEGLALPHLMHVSRESEVLAPLAPQTGKPPKPGFASFLFFYRSPPTQSLSLPFESEQGK